MSILNNKGKKAHTYDKTKVDVIESGMVRVNDLIAPEVIENHETYIRVGNRFMRTLIVVGYPPNVSFGWLQRLYSIAANIDISTHIEPMPTNHMVKSLNRKIGEFRSTINMDAQKGRVTDPEMEMALEDALELRDNLTRGYEKLFYQSLFINAAAKTLDELDLITEEVEKLCGTLQLYTRHATLEQLKGFMTVLPIADRRLRHRRNFDSSALAACMPFISAEMTDMRGNPILYGINVFNRSLVMFDRWMLPNKNSLILATTGYGKSYTVKLEATRMMMMGAEIIAIDPEGEYVDIAEAKGGQHVKVSSNSTHRLNPLEIHSIIAEEGTDFLTQKILDVYSILEVMLQRKFEPFERRVVLQALENTYNQFGISRDSKDLKTNKYVDGDMFNLGGNRKRMPTLTHLGINLRNYEQGIKIAEELDPFINGVLNIFNGETNVDTNSPFLVFNTRETEKALEEVAMFVVLEFIWNKIKSGDGRRRILIVDEAWTYMKNAQTADYLVRVAKRARKWNAGLSIITQQAEDFLVNGGEAIIASCATKVLLRQEKSTLPLVREKFGLSSSEEYFLKTFDRGEALIFADGKKTAIKIISSDLEHMMCSTDQEDKLRFKEFKRQVMQGA
ncbi:hypothetical protein bcgnr5390_14680 [Bacillus luti]|nr:hypothetical protein BC2903_46890 [Bacillus cereus]